MSAERLREAAEALATMWERAADSVPATLTAGVYYHCAAVLRDAIAESDEREAK